MTCSRCYIVFNVQKIACEHLRDADCTTSMKVYKKLFPLLIKKISQITVEKVMNARKQKISDFEEKKICPWSSLKFENNLLLVLFC